MQITYYNKIIFFYTYNFFIRFIKFEFIKSIIKIFTSKNISIIYKNQYIISSKDYKKLWKFLIYIITSNFLKLLNEFTVTRIVDHIKLKKKF
jgi:hypothetical protein